MRRRGSRGTFFVALWAVIALTACGGGGSPGGGGKASGEGTSPGYSASPAKTPSSGAAPWPLPDDPLSLVEPAGLTPAVKEFFTYHVHAHLDVFLNGEPVLVPAGIGIDIDDPAVHTGEFNGGPTYGGIERCDQPCISPLHTHDVLGVIHIEAPKKTSFTLGQFFIEWGVTLDGSCVGGYCSPETDVAVFVDGKQQSGDAADIALSNYEEIAIVIGTPPSSIPGSFDFSSTG